jgi:hypothetical protein
METAYCAYCTQPFERVGRKYAWDRPAKATCGRKLCRSRTTSWNAWVRPTWRFGDVNKAMRRATRLPSLMNDEHFGAAVTAGLFEVTTELEEAA